MQKHLMLASCLSLALFAGGAQAQATFPAKPIRIVIGFDPGGPVDVLARLVGGKMGEGMGQSVIADNRPGAEGVIGGDFVAKSAPDGYTLLIVGLGQAINPNFAKNLPYNFLNDFTPVVQLATSPFVLVVHPSVPAQNTAELIKYAKANPDKLSYGSVGLGSSLMMGMELLNEMAGIKTVHVPYKGGAPATNDLIAGRIQIMVNNAVSSLPVARSGKLRALAVTTAQRSPVAPDLPAIAETVPGYDVSAWYGFTGPKGIPPAIVNKLNGEAVKVLATDDIRQKFAPMGLTPAPSSPEQFGKLLQSEVAKWAKVVKEGNFPME